MARGRKPKGEYSGKNAVFSTRITDELRQQLKEASKTSGRSLSQEVEYRLRRSFDTDRNITKTFGDIRNYAFFRLLDLIVKETRAADLIHPSFWLDDPFRYQQAVVAITAALEVFRPRLKLPKGTEKAHEALYSLGLLAAGAVLNDIRTADPKNWDEFSPEIGVQESLKDLVERIPENFFDLDNVKAFLGRDNQ